MNTLPTRKIKPKPRHWIVAYVERLAAALPDRFRWIDDYRLCDMARQVPAGEDSMFRFTHMEWREEYKADWRFFGPLFDEFNVVVNNSRNYTSLFEAAISELVTELEYRKDIINCS